MTTSNTKEKIMSEHKQQEMERIDEIVFRYQQGDRSAGEELLKLFGCHPDQGELGSYIGKYYKLLRYGRINFDDRDTRKFVSAFMSNKQFREAMKQWYQYAPTMKEARKTMQRVSDTLRFLDDDDFKQDLRMLFLQQATRYKKKYKKIYFTGYLYNSYRWAVVNHIVDTFKKREPFLHRVLRKVHEDVVADERSTIEVDESIYIQSPIMEVDDELGNSWIRGLTCGDEFKNLTPLQRLILKLHNEEGYTDGEISKKLNMHINTIHRHRKKASLQVQEDVKRLIEEGYYE